MKKFFTVIALIICAIFISACQSRDRVVRVIDANTNIPISGALVYAHDYNAFDPFATSGLFKTGDDGTVFLGDSYSNILASAVKEGYEYTDASDTQDDGKSLVTTIKLIRETSVNREPKIEMFKPFSSDSRTQSILKEMRQYFSKRNTIMVFEGQPYIVEVNIKVLDADTNEPISNAMVYVRSGSYSDGRLECIELSDENGNTRATMNLMSPSLNIDAGKEGYAPTKRFSKDPNKHGVYTVFLSKKGSAGSIVLGDTSEYSRRKTNIRNWERFKKYYISKGGTFKYLREVR